MSKRSLPLNLLFCGLAALFLNSCADTVPIDKEKTQMIVSVKDQKMLLTQHGKPVKTYKVSTSKFGVGDRPNSMCTPLGRMLVAKKIGHNQPLGAVFKSRRPTGEVLKPNAPGRDPIVTRIIWLRGTQKCNKNAFARYIYIHGTPEESRIGQAASYGCIRMKSEDIADLYARIGLNAEVQVIQESLKRPVTGREYVQKAKGVVHSLAKSDQEDVPKG